MSETSKTFRRFADGQDRFDAWTDQIFSGGWSSKCPTYVLRTPPCQAGCPSGHDVRGWLAIARGQDKPAAGQAWQEYAFRRMTEANPFPAVMGRVCPAPCEDGCNRNEIEDHVGINSIEHHVGDWAIVNNMTFAAPEAETGKHVAVVGGGPAGLAAAYHLRRLGHGVTLFEAQDELGGMMRYGIPEFRVPRRVLDAEIGRIIGMGVAVRTGVKIGGAITKESLERDFDAVFWGIGAQKGLDLDIPGFDAPNCITGVDFLDVVNRGWVVHTAKRIVVIGGGDTSIDVASVARRLGHIKQSHAKDHIDAGVWNHTAHDVASSAVREGVEVVLTSLFPVEGMTAATREREEALREGVSIRGGVMPLEVIKDADGKAKALRMCECDMEGMTPVPRPGTEFLLWCDMIVAAIGQRGDLQGIEAFDNGRGFVKADKHFRVGGQTKHFAGGDVLRPHLLTTAIGHGRIAAQTIDQFLAAPELPRRPKVDVHHFNLLDELRRHDRAPDPYDHQPTRGTCDADFAVHNFEDRSASEIVAHDQLFKAHFKAAPRHARREIQIAATKVIGNFAERLTGLDEAQAVAEAKRCMSCGLCFECDNCLIFCPQVAVQKVPKAERVVGRYVETDYGKCVGCHICRDVCPSSYIQMGLGE